jgi:single-strand DNA-binding protein
MNGMNKTEIIGNLTRDAELKMVPIDGKPTPRCRFSVAVNETRANGEPIVTYFEVTAWREYAAKIAPWLLKGRQVFVSGKVRLNQYIDASHNVRTSMQLHSPEVILLGKKPEIDVAAVDNLEEVTEEINDDELPFG